KVLIIDCFGLLSSAYTYADIAYVGGGFGAGLHNINEAAVYGVPVIYGPNNAKFIEAQEMKTLGGGIEVTDKESFGNAIDLLTRDAGHRLEKGEKSAAYIRGKLGATDKIYAELFR
ncbi:MAG: 3-deoxy-D-manno-octulosonic acid transferase, partial [Muribaculaceae bacterium]|nr:3-deoxy-D-manno-octulosonic acid transferase [Muribaculaceae bacterium]